MDDKVYMIDYNCRPLYGQKSIYGDFCESHAAAFDIYKFMSMQMCSEHHMGIDINLTMTYVVCIKEIIAEVLLPV